MIKTIIFNALFILAFSVAASATEEDVTVDDFGKDKPKTLSLSNKSNKPLNSFSLKSGMLFKGDNVINNQMQTPVYLNFNTSVTYQKGQNTYLLPYKKKVILNRVTFNPNSQLREFSGR